VDILIFTVFIISLFFIVKTTNADREAEDKQSIQNEAGDSEMKDYEVVELLSERELVKHLKKMHSAKLSIEKGDLQKAKREFEAAMEILENGVDFKLRKLSPPSACYVDYSRFLYNIGDHENSKKILLRYVDLCRACGDIHVSVENLNDQVKKSNYFKNI